MYEEIEYADDYKAIGKLAEEARTERKGGMIMDLNDEKKTQAKYDRFVDFMARMYLKYETKYRIVTAEDVMKMFSKRQHKKEMFAEKI